MYASKINGILYTFEASGSLWQDALVIRDRETGSLWSQISGVCISGPMEGTTLKQYPVFHTTFKEFKIQYPKGVLLDKSKKGLKGSHYDSYFKDKTKLGILGRIDNFNRFQAKEKIFGLRLENVEVAISKVYLKKHKYWVINTDKSRVIIHYNSDSETARAFYLPPGAQTNDDIAVTNNTILLRDKGNVWSFSTGNVIQGNGLALRPVPVITAFWFAWVSFFPQTILIN